jgi:galactose mutarotase-like enzyme
MISLSSGELSADIDPLGAQLSALRDAEGRDLLWNGDPAVWSGRAPILFPIVGELAGGEYRLDANSYRLPRHGFARRSAFEVLASGKDSALFRLRASDGTRAVYPFEFELRVEFALTAATLTVTATVQNHGSRIMPASFGYHPAFAWPLPYGRPRSAHFIDFAQDEPAAVRRLNAAGLLSPARRETPVVGRRLALDDALFADDALIFDDLRSRSVRYGAADGPAIRVDFPNTTLLGLWSKTGARFVCIEPWHGIADSAGFTGDFRDKPQVFSISPGAAVVMPMMVTLLPATGDASR